jgi:hypothetical protein
MSSCPINRSSRWIVPVGSVLVSTAAALAMMWQGETFGTKREQWAAIVEHWVTVVALVVGGAWVVYQYVIRRSGETGLSIAVSHEVAQYADGRRFVFVDVGLKNTGPTMLQASGKSAAELRDAFEGSVSYAGSLQIFAFDPLPAGAVAHLDWWGSGTASGHEAVPEINLLDEYNNADGQYVEFFMEPGEEYHLGSALVLLPGSYLAKVAFVGSDVQEYWSRIVPLIVP